MTKRMVIFAGYNRKSRIEDYVLYYLKGLREIADTLIYVADNEASDIYKSQLEGIADNIILERHGEYDFGSWKRGLRLASRLSSFNDVDELVLCNDSCYGPIFPFSEMFASMENSACDFWGITKNCSDVLEHVQSYFLVFKKNVFSSVLFREFFEGVTKEKCFWDVVTRYEVGLSRLLIEKGNFRFDVYCPSINRFDTLKFGCKLVDMRCPIIKRKLFTTGLSKQSLLRLLCVMPNVIVRRHMVYDYIKYFPKRIGLGILRFIYQDKVTKSGHRIIKICKIPFIVVSKEYNF